MTLGAARGGQRRGGTPPPCWSARVATTPPGPAGRAGYGSRAARFRTPGTRSRHDRTLRPRARRSHRGQEPRPAGASRRPRPEQKRVWASVEKTPEPVIEEAFREADHRDATRQKTWVALVDGNKTQLRFLRRMAKKNRLKLTLIVDIVHVIKSRTQSVSREG